MCKCVCVGGGWGIEEGGSGEERRGREGRRGNLSSNFHGKEDSFPRILNNFFLGCCWPKLKSELIISGFKPNHDLFSVELRMESLSPKLPCGLTWEGEVSKEKSGGRGMDTIGIDVLHESSVRPFIMWPQRATASPPLNPFLLQIGTQ